MLIRLCAAILVLGFASALQCFTGFSIIKGQTIGTQTKNCGKTSDYCYNATADVATISQLQKAGCNSVICRLHGNKCFDQSMAGKKVTFCCCNEGDLCNGGDMTNAGGFLKRGLSVLKGFMGG